MILDGVFNHCGSFNKWLDAEQIYERSGDYAPGAFVSKDSPYHTFFQFRDESDEAWPYNRSYDGWWGHDTLPELNYESSKKLEEYILRIARKWVSPPYSVDGWRLDVAADLGHTAEYNHVFWKKFRAAVKEANPNAVILAEHYGDPSSWLQGDQWDSVMNYDAFMEPVTWFLTGMEKHSDSYNSSLWGSGESFFESMRYHMSRMQTNTVLTAMNQLSNHDHSRFLTRTNRIVGRTATVGPEKASENVQVCVLREAVVIQMTWPGAPTLYYGDEAGVCGWTDPDSRRTYPWGKENLELIEFHRYLTGLRRRYPVFRRGALKPLFAGRHQIAYGRMEGKYQAVIAVSNCPEPQSMEIPVWQLGITDDMILGRPILTAREGYNAGIMLYRVKNGCLRLIMPAYGAAVFLSHPEEFYPIVDSRFAEESGEEVYVK